MSSKELSKLRNEMDQLRKEVAELRKIVKENGFLSKQPIKPDRAPKKKSDPVIDGPVIVEKYSEKSILVKGSTKPIKDSLKEIGGKWNGKLMGWIYPLGKDSDIREKLKEIGIKPEFEGFTNNSEDEKSDSEDESGSESGGESSDSEDED